MKATVRLFDAATGAELTVVAEATDESSASWYGLPVVVVEGEPLGPGDLARDWGPAVFVVTDDAEVAERLRRAGYKTSAPPGPGPTLARYPRYLGLCGLALFLACGGEQMTPPEPAPERSITLYVSKRVSADGDSAFFRGWFELVAADPSRVHISARVCRTTGRCAYNTSIGSSTVSEYFTGLNRHPSNDTLIFNVSARFGPPLQPLEWETLLSVEQIHAVSDGGPVADTVSARRSF